MGINGTQKDPGAIFIYAEIATSAFNTQKTIKKICITIMIMEDSPQHTLQPFGICPLYKANWICKQPAEYGLSKRSLHF